MGSGVNTPKNAPASARTDLPVVYTSVQVADILSVSEKTIRRYTRDGLIWCSRIGDRAIRYSPAHLHTFLAACDDVGVLTG